MKSINYIKKHFLIIFLLLSALVYISNSWSPSSYSLALNMIGVNSSPDFGTSRQIRTDEYWVQTPLTQALVHNKFQRLNSSSIYNEDLRINYGLPIADWGMIFKPTQWAYFFLQPAYAFSIYYFLLFAIFVAGYQFFFERLGLKRFPAFIFSLSLYFSGAIQAWWTVNATTFAYFPWVMLALHATLNRHFIFSISVFYLLVCWQVGNLYPPFSYALALAGVVWIMNVNVTFKNKSLNILCLLVMSLLAVLVVYLYFSDYYQIMKDTVYPGSRNVGGGSYLSLPMLFSLFIPSAWYDLDFSVLIFKDRTNICEISTFSTILPLLLIFISITRYKINLSSLRVFIKSNAISIVVLFVMLIWVLYPVPPSIGKFLLLNKITPNRLMLGVGLIVSIFSALILVKQDFKVSTWELIVFWALYLFIVSLIKSSYSEMKIDLMSSSLACIIMLLLNKTKVSSQITILSGCLVFSLFNFGLFNPLMDSKPIFAYHDTPLIQKLKQEQSKDGYILGYELPGAIANGLGFKSIAHVNTTPQLDFWRNKFSSLSNEQFNGVFNRYAHIQLYDQPNITTPSADVIRIPKRCFNEGVESSCPDVEFAR